jgi:thiazole synthase ThiGH ThiG subunit
MDPVLIFELIQKGLTTIPLLIDAGINISQRIKQLSALAKGGADGTLTDAALAKIRSDFDQDLADFNAPMGE